MATIWLPTLSLWVAVIVAVVLIGLHASLQHEMIHDHPFRNRTLDAAQVCHSLNLAIPYLRFRDTHLAHHRDADLTNP